MPSGQLSTPVPHSFRTWLKWVVALLACLGILAGAAYVTRYTLLLNVARIVLNHDSELVAQERADTVAIVFAKPLSVWTTPMKNRMNDIWEPIKAEWGQLLYVCETANLVQSLQRALESNLTLLPGLGWRICDQDKGRLTPYGFGILGVASDRARSTFVAICNGRSQSDRRFVYGDSGWEYHRRRSQPSALAWNHAKP